MLELPRRSFITGLVSLLAAPAIVRASSLMPVKALPFDNINIRFEAGTYNLREVQNLLLPGLEEIRSQYELLPAVWERLFND